MNRPDANEFSNLGRFCDEDFNDPWELQEAKDAYDPERYQDKTYLASGAQKKVYKVFDRKMQRHIALAELHEGIPEEDYDAFFEEASLTASLRHPNIVTVYDYGFNEAYLPYFTMELKVGDTLADVIVGQQKSLSERLVILGKVCDAIAYAHSQGIVHLDLKPANIQVGQYGEVQVCDWGLSRRMGDLETTKGLKGTPGYMAPEQTVEGAALDTRADIYALGGILYSILTNHAPIAGGLNTVLDATRNDAVVAPSERCPDTDIPESLEAVVNKALAAQKDDRYQSVADFKNEVENYLQGRSTQAENAGIIKELSLLIKRNKQVCTLSFAAVAILVLAAAIFIVALQNSKAETEIALNKLQEAHTQMQALRRQEKALFEQKEDAFEMYKAAVEERQLFAAQLVDEQLNHAHELMVYPLYFGSPKENLDTAYKILISHHNSQKPRQDVEDLIVVNLFLSQRYSLLRNFTSKKYQALIRIANDHNDLARSAGPGVLSDKDLLSVLQALNALPAKQQKIKQAVMERVLCYSLDARGAKHLHGQIVSELLQCWNTEWDATYSFSHKTSPNSLTISGRALTRLRGVGSHSSGLSFLRLLPVDILDLRGSGIDSLSHIEGLSVKRLDIRDTVIDNLHPHGTTARIETVILNTGQLDESLKVPRSVQVVYED